jgi:hypothetical protein
MKPTFKFGALLIVSSILAACSSDSDNGNVVVTPLPDQDAQFEITVTNLTNAQPLSPVAIMLHNAGFHSFIDGETSSTALELLAEGGDNSEVLAEAQAALQHLAAASTEGPIPPSAISPAVSLSVPADQLDDLRLSVITMLVHTNDAFSGANAANVSGMAVGETRTMNGPTWDSGTEANSETRATMPGPDFGGEGFNAERDDPVNLVRFHQSVVTSESAEFGLPTSDLRDRHRFLNPTTRITVTRVQ